MMRARRLVSTISLVPTPVSRKTGAMASEMTWPMSVIWIFIKMRVVSSMVQAQCSRTPGAAPGSVKTAMAAELLGGRHQRPGNACFKGAVAGVGNHAQGAARPGQVQAVG